MAKVESFPPDPAFAAQANATADAVRRGRDATPRPSGRSWPASGSTWSKPFDTTLEWDLPFAKWFVGGKLNVSVQLRRPARRERPRRQGRVPLDRRARRHPDDHLRRPPARGPEDRQRAQGAGHREGRPRRDLHADDPGAADRDARLRPASGRRTRSSSAASRRRRWPAGSTTAEAKLVITADGGWRRGKPAPLKPAVDEALDETPVGRARARRAPTRRRGRDGDDDRGARRLVARHRRSPAADCPPVPLDCEHMLYLLYTSGTTAKPKGILHTTAGYLLGTSFTHEMVFDIKPDDVYWCAADIGWVTGHSYIVYGPLANATTGVMYEGTPDTPAWDRWWQIIEDYKVTILYCAPTAIRAFMKQGDSTPGEARPVVAAGPRLRRRADQPRGLALVPRAHRRRRRRPIVDTWWQTETGHDPDHAAARRHDHEAGQRDLPVPGHRGRRRRRRGRLASRSAVAATSS